MNEENITAKNIKCHHCSHEWKYTGKSEYYCTCPTCMFKVNIEKNMVVENGDNR